MTIDPGHIGIGIQMSQDFAHNNVIFLYVGLIVSGQMNQNFNFVVF